MVPVTVTSFALSLLLVFKTNNSFARWGPASFMLDLWRELRDAPTPCLTCPWAAWQQ